MKITLSKDQVTKALQDYCNNELLRNPKTIEAFLIDKDDSMEITFTDISA